MILPIPIVILAAGGSRRLGTPKQLVSFRGRSLLAHAVATARATTRDPVLVVVGSGTDDLRAEVSTLGARVIENPDWAEGLGSTVRAAIVAVEAQVPEASAVLFTVCDQPLTTRELLDQIVREHRAGHDLVGSAYAGAVGVPALFARRFFGELRGLVGDSGARRVLARHESEVLAVPFPGGVVDVDTPEDAARLANLAQSCSDDPIEILH